MEFYSKDIQILRQSQSKLALEYCVSIGVQISFEELQWITDTFVECCLRPQDETLKEKIKKIDLWLTNKKKNQNG